MLWSAFIIGLFGSLHCLGMCGPIALALPGGQGATAKAYYAVQYNTGRTITYMVMGLVFGLLGQSVRLAGFQSLLSVSLGVMVLLLAFFTLDFEQRVLDFPILNRFYGRVQQLLGRILRRPGVHSALLIGLLNGFLPCGLVYAAIFGAIGTGKVLDGALFMGVFGLGTFPLMLSVAFAGQWLGLSWRRRLRRLIPFVLVIMGLLLISRGLNFDLPHDFRFWQNAADQPICH